MLIRQNMRDAGEDYKSIVLGLKFGGVPSINSLEAVYHFQVSRLLLLNGSNDFVSYYHVIGNRLETNQSIEMASLAGKSFRNNSIRGRV